MKFLEVVNHDGRIVGSLMLEETFNEQIKEGHIILCGIVKRNKVVGYTMAVVENEEKDEAYLQGTS